MARMVVSQTSGNTPALGGLFEGLSFFLVQRVPSRTSFVEKIQANGGRVVKLEAQADHIIADHVRKDCPPGSISYKFIECAIRDGALPDPGDHKAGPSVGAIRDVGSVVPGKTTRTPFTAEDDRVLWQWVERARQQGGSVKGNDIYKQLETRNNRHTFQAWRDRYIKKLMDKPPAGVELKVAARAPPSPPDAPDEDVEVEVEVRAATGQGTQNASSQGKKRKANQEQESVRDEAEEATFTLPRASQSTSPQKKSARKATEQAKPHVIDDDVDDWGENFFNDNDFRLVMEQAEDIEGLPEENVDTAWKAWKQAYPLHTAKEWRMFWEKKVRPEYKRQRAERRAAKKLKRSKSLKPDDYIVVKDEDSKAVKSQSGAIETTLPLDIDREALPAKDRSASSQQRKRETPTPRAKSTHSREKHEPDFSNLLDDEPEGIKQPEAQRPRKLVSPAKPSTQIIEILSDDDDEVQEVKERPLQTLDEDDGGEEQLWMGVDTKMDAQEESRPTSDANRAADEQARITDTGLQGAVETGEEPIQTPEVEEAAQDQSYSDELVVDDGNAMEIDEYKPSDLPTTDANRAVDEQVERETRPLAEEEAAESSSQQRTSNLLTSDANRAAEQQIRWESFEEEDEQNPVSSSPKQIASNIPTSDANRAAEHQLRQESTKLSFNLNDQDATPRQPISQPALLSSQRNDLVISNHLIEDGEVEDGLPGEEVIEPDDSGDALTEANLASQQAQHQAQLLRGMDLQEDDEGLDQSDYVAYLQALTGKKVDVEAAEAREETTPKVRHKAQPQNEMPEELLDQMRYTHNDGKMPPNSDEPDFAGTMQPPQVPEHDDLLDQTQYTHNEAELTHMSDDFHAPAFPDLPLSSQQELDDIFEANLQWPASPEASQRKPATQATRQESQSLRFETQIAYPALSSQEADGDDEMFTSQPPRHEDATYPALPQYQDRNRSGEVKTGLDFSSQRKVASQRPRTQQEDTEMLGEVEEPPVSDVEGEEDEELNIEDEIDLSIPEPEGGFGFSSPPAKSVASQPLRRAMEQASSPVKVQSQRVYTPDDVGGDTNDDIEVDEEDEADLTIREPEGDLSLLSSLEQSLAAQPLHKALGPTSGRAEDRTQYADNTIRDNDDRETKQAKVPDVIEVSSASSSSSSYDSSEPPSSALEQQEAKVVKAMETQDILDAETQEPDFSMPLPPDSDEESEELPSPAAQPVRPTSVAKSPNVQAGQSQRPPVVSPSQSRPPPAERARPTLAATQPPTQLRQTQSLRSTAPPPRPPPRRTHPETKQPSQTHAINLTETQTLDDDDFETYVATMTVRGGYDEVTILDALQCTSMRPELAELVLLERKAGRGVPGDVAGVWTEDEDKVAESGDARSLRRLQEKHGWDEMVERMKFLEEWRSG